MSTWPPAARDSDPQTSADAEVQFTATGNRWTIAARVEAMLREVPGLTYSEIAELTGLRPDQVWRRLSDLKNLGHTYQSGTRVINGYQQGVWWPAKEMQLSLLP